MRMELKDIWIASIILSLSFCLLIVNKVVESGKFVELDIIETFFFFIKIPCKIIYIYLLIDHLNHTFKVVQGAFRGLFFFFLLFLEIER